MIRRKISTKTNMEVLSSLIRVTVPNYLQNLPIPSSIMGISKLSGSEWLQLLPIVGTLSLLAYVTFQAFKSKPVPKDARVNLRIQKESSKVVNMVDIEELGDKVSYCRCWRSKRFPICDGSHNKHNEETGDNVGPLVLKRKEPLATK